MADTIVDLERKFYIQQLGLSAGQASVMSAQDLDAQIDSRAFILPSSSDYKPAITVAENMPRSYAGALVNGAYATGRIYLTAIYLTAGMSITSVIHQNGTTVATGQTNFWGSLWSPTFTKIAVSQDETTNIVGNIAEKAFVLVGGPYIIPTTGIYYTGICYVGTGSPTPLSCLSTSVVTSLPLALGTLTTVTGMTTPALCPNSVTPINPGNAIAYMQVR